MPNCMGAWSLNVLRHFLRLALSALHVSAAASDRFFWAWLSELWSCWRIVFIIVKPETVIAWHRKSFRLFWTWKFRYGQPGRPSVSKDIRALIRKMRRDSPLWGAPRIHGELLKPGIDIG